MIILVEEFDLLFAGDDPCADTEFDLTDVPVIHFTIIRGGMKGLDSHHLSGVLSANVAVLVIPLALVASLAAVTRMARFPYFLVLNNDVDAIAIVSAWAYALLSCARK